MNKVVTVVADGAWSKRSYKSNYNASSGVASIVGYRTKKYLFMSVRNKYCAICDRALKTNHIVREHKCYKIWTSTSTSIESDIIVEGFKERIAMHNIIYNKLIGDGDSSVSKKLLLAKPYGPDVLIQKIECKNHDLRNYINPEIKETPWEIIYKNFVVQLLRQLNIEKIVMEHIMKKLFIKT
jgi:hypothetical protein